MHNKFLRNNKLIVTYHLISEFELKNLLKKVEEILKLDDFYKLISYEEKDDIILFNKIRNYNRINCEPKTLRYVYKKENSLISFSPQMCIVEFSKNDNQEFFQTIIHKIVNLLTSLKEISLLDIYLENSNIVLFKNKKNLIKYTNIFKDIPKKEDITIIEEENINNFINIENIKKISKAELNRKEYTYLEFFNNIKIDFTYTSFDADKKRIEKDIKEFENIIKKSFNKTFKDIKLQDIEVCGSFNIIGGS